MGDAIYAGLSLGALGIAVVGSLRHHDHWVEFMGLLLTLFVAVGAVQIAVDAWALAARGRTTTCTVLRVDEQFETSTTPSGVTRTTHYYINHLSCVTPQVRVVTGESSR